MRPALILLHGWGLDARLWDSLAAILAAYRSVRWDRGYFGSPAEFPVEGPVVGIGHSLGAMLLADMLPDDAPLVAINGFDRFTGPDAVPSRVVERMQARFAETPRQVLADFRARSGAPPFTSPIDERRLADDLAILATGCAMPSRRATLVLHGASDPILPSSLRQSVFPGAPRAEHAGGGHLLPLTHPGWCAEQIEAWLCR